MVRGRPPPAEEQNGQGRFRGCSQGCPQDSDSLHPWGLITPGLEVCLPSLCAWLNGSSCEKRPGLLIIFQPLWILVLVISLICTFGGSPGVCTPVAFSLFPVPPSGLFLPPAGLQYLPSFPYLCSCRVGHSSWFLMSLTIRHSSTFRGNCSHIPFLRYLFFLSFIPNQGGNCVGQHPRRARVCDQSCVSDSL